MQCVQAVPRDGLGFPIIPIVMGVVSAVGALKGKGGGKPKEADAKEAVRQIYLELLGREPDPGAKGYIDCLIKGAQHDPNKGWCDVDFIRTEILKGSEYRDVEMRKAREAYGLAPGGALPSSGAPGAAPYPPGAGPYPPAGDAPGTIFGIPILYVVGGVALLMLMKR